MLSTCMHTRVGHRLLLSCRQRIIRLASTEALADEYIPPRELSEVATKWTTWKRRALKEEIIEYLDWKMEDDWKLMSLEEKRACYFIGYGNWGPRAAKIGTKPETAPVSVSYLLMRSVFNLLLFGAVGVSILNLQKDKKMEQVASETVPVRE